MIETVSSAFELKAVSAAGVFEGYASVFADVDLSKDSVRPGAFAKAIAERGADGIKLLWQHDPAEPIGVIEELFEDGRGLYVKGRLLLDVQRAREALALMRKGALDGLSIGFRTVRSATEEATGIRHLEEVDLWEVSLVTFPMQPAARVRHLKAAAPRPAESKAGWPELLKSLRRLEQSLTK